jgi:hypothetical protein
MGIGGKFKDGGLSPMERVKGWGVCKRGVSPAVRGVDKEGGAGGGEGEGGGFLGGG